MNDTKAFKTLLLSLLEKLERVGENNEEIYDTECRDKMLDFIWNSFVLPSSNYKTPDDFGMFESIANKQVKKAIEEYIEKASVMADDNQMNFQQKLAVFQDSDVATSSDEKIEFDDFFGWCNPDRFDSEGNHVEFHSYQ
jgi:hypothetical protein